MPKVRCSKTDSILSLVEVYEIEKALCVELIARRYRVTAGQARSEYERVATLLERRRQARPILPPPANVSETRRPGVSAMLPHYYDRVVPKLVPQLASRFENPLGNAAFAAAGDALQMAVVRLGHLAPTAGAPVLPFEHPLVRSGVNYLYTAAANRIISQYHRGGKKRCEVNIQENMTFTSPSYPGSSASLASTPMSEIWGRFWRLCGSGAARETACALVEDAKLFRHGGSVEDRFVFFHAWLDGDRFSECPEPKWVKSHVQILLGLDDDAMNQRKFRLKAVWKTARQGVLSRRRVASMR